MTLSCSRLGMAIIRDTVTQRKIQQLEHAGICCFWSSMKLFNINVRNHQLRSLFDCMVWLFLGIKCTCHFLVRKGIPCFEQQVHHRNSESNGMPHNKCLECTDFPSSGLGEQWSLLPRFKTFIDLLAGWVPHRKGLGCCHLGCPIGRSNTETDGESPQYR